MIEKSFGIRIGFIAVACGIISAGLAFFTDPIGTDPLLVPLVGVAIGAIIGVSLRGREIIDVLACAFASMFMFYMGFGTVRSFESNLLLTHWKITGPYGFTPILFVGAASYSVLFSVFVSYPLSLIPSWNIKPRERDEAFLKYLSDQGDKN